MPRPSTPPSRLARRLMIGCALALPTLVLAQTITQRPPPPTIPGRGGPIIVRQPRRIADVKMAIPPDNPQTDVKIALGRRLFFDAQLSIDRTVSCATCHEPERAFADTRPLAVGVFGRVGKRNSPALVNRGLGRLQFWDGRAQSLEAQVVQPIEDPNEMASSVDETVKRLAADASYRTEFQTAFFEPVTAVNLGRALASYLRTVRSADSPFDRFVDGQTDALSLEAQTGMRIFRSKARCVFCHQEPTFTDEQLHNTGVAFQPGPDGAALFQDDGRFAITRLDRDRGAFKTPTLREVALTAPYMHDGSLKTLAEVVDFYDRGGRQNPHLSRLLRPIGLTVDEKQALIKFLESLSGTVTGK